MLMRRLAVLVLITALFCPASGDAIEKYYIDEQPVLLYKIINWWNTCPPEDCGYFCGKTLFGTDQGNIQVETGPKDSLLKLRVDDPFADMIAWSGQAETVWGSSRMQCTWLNKKYFGGGIAEDLNRSGPRLFDLRFTSVSDKHRQLLKTVEKDSGIVLKGVIGGLANSKIALYPSGKGSDTCSGESAAGPETFPLSLIIVNAHTSEVLAEYTARPE